jgi:hypothetical protein
LRAFVSRQTSAAFSDIVTRRTTCGSSPKGYPHAFTKTLFADRLARSGLLDMRAQAEIHTSLEDCRYYGAVEAERFTPRGEVGRYRFPP